MLNSCLFFFVEQIHRSVLPIFRYFESPDNLKQLLYLFPRQKYWDKCSLDFSNLERISVPLGDSKNRILALYIGLSSRCVMRQTLQLKMCGEQYVIR